MQCALWDFDLNIVSYLAPRLWHARVLRLAVSDEVLLLKEGEGAILASPPLLLLVVDLHMCQQIPLPLELLHEEDHESSLVNQSLFKADLGQK